MSNTIDHFILAVSPEEQDAIADALISAGFVDHGRSKPAPAEGFGLGEVDLIRNQYLSFSGGGFIEMLTLDIVTPEREIWFDETPRIQGVGYCTDSYEEQAAPWSDLPGSWNEEFGTLGDDEHFWAAGPVTHDAKFYTFIMGRPHTPYTDVPSAVKLREVIFAGRRSGDWEERFAGWFELEKSDDGYRSTDGILHRFVEGDHPDMRVSLVFDVPGKSTTIPISGGSIQLREATS